MQFRAYSLCCRLGIFAVVLFLFTLAAHAQEAPASAATPGTLSAMEAPAGQRLGVFDVLQKGGSLMWVLLLCSIIGLGVFVERAVYYRRQQINVAEFLVGILSLLRRRQYLEALERCDEAHGPVVNVVRAAIGKRHLPPDQLRAVIRETAQLESHALEANLPVIATVGYLSPLIGLLGTVIGMIEAFLQISRTGGGASIADLAGGIWTALITTAGGLVIAIPCYAAYNYLVARSHHLIGDMERAGIEVAHVLSEPAYSDKA